MKLLYQTHSPYARKVLVFAHEVGLAKSIHVEHHETSPTRSNEAVFDQNPLGKVPVLLRSGLDPLFDSDVICAYLDTLHDGTPLIPSTGEAKWRALRMQSVAQDLANVGIALRWETVRRPEPLRYPPLSEGYIRKLTATYRWLDAEFGSEASLHIGQIALATVLDWFAFRDLPSFRDHPRLSEWFDRFAQRPSMQATPLTGETQD